MVCAFYYKFTAMNELGYIQLFQKLLYALFINVMLIVLKCIKVTDVRTTRKLIIQIFYCDESLKKSNDLVDAQPKNIL